MIYCGIDLASKASAVCIMDSEGRILAEFQMPTDEDGFRTRLGDREPMQCVLEASPLAEWAIGVLESLGHSAQIIDPRRAKSVIRTKRKTDQIDARNLANLARTGWYNAVHRKSERARLMRTLLKSRQGLLKAASDQHNRILGLLRAHGIRVGKGGGDGFELRVLGAVRARAPELEVILEPLLDVWRQAREHAKELEKRLQDLVRGDRVCQRLMSVPGVGPVISAAYVATIDDPHRFENSDQVADYLGLVPSVYQSGETEYRGRITKEGDKMLRWLLVEGAAVLLSRVKRSCALQRWGRKLAAKKGLAKARVAVARKLAVLLHRLWVTGERFDWARA